MSDKPGTFKKGNQAKKGHFIAPAVLEGRKLTRHMFEEVIYKYMNYDYEQLKALIRDPGKTPAIELLVVSIMARAIGQGDTARSEFLLRRSSIGPVIDKVEVKTEDVTDKAQVDALANKLIEAMKK